MCNVYSILAGGVPDLDSRKAKGASKIRDCDSPNDQVFLRVVCIDLLCFFRSLRQRRDVALTKRGA